MLEPVAQPMTVEAFFVWQERQADKQRIVGLAATADLPAIGISLSLAELYDGVAFPARPRLVQDETPGDVAG